MELRDIEIHNLLRPLGIAATLDVCEAIRNYISLLLRWNERVSLTTVTEIPEILQFHFAESFFAASAVPIREGRLADVGSGAGFPGLPIRILVPKLELVLIESNAKKAAFLAEVVRKLDLDRVQVFRGRMEDLPSALAAFDFITARAIGGYAKLLKWAHTRLGSSGRLVLWLGKEDADLIARESGWSWHAPYPIPGSIRRFLLVGSSEETSNVSVPRGT